MSRAAVTFVVAVVVFATATVGFGHGGGSASLLSDEERLDIEFTVSEGTDEFDVVEQSPETTESPSAGTDDSNSGATTEPGSGRSDETEDSAENSGSDTAPAPPAVAGNHTVAPPTLPTKSAITAPTALETP